MRQRLGELYETKGMPDNALVHYKAFVDQWKNADAPLQPRVRDVRGRIERLQAQIFLHRSPGTRLERPCAIRRRRGAITFRESHHDTILKDARAHVAIQEH